MVWNLQNVNVWKHVGSRWMDWSLAFLGHMSFVLFGGVGIGNWLQRDVRNTWGLWNRSVSWLSWWYTTPNIYPNSSNLSLKLIVPIVCKLYLSIADWNQELCKWPCSVQEIWTLIQFYFYRFYNFKLVQLKKMWTLCSFHSNI